MTLKPMWLRRFFDYDWMPAFRWYDGISIGTIGQYAIKQSGVVLVAFLLVLVTGASFVLLRGLNAAATQSYRERADDECVGGGESGFIGRAATDNYELPIPSRSWPCPDLDKMVMPLSPGPACRA